MRIPYGFSVTDCGEFVVEESAANHIKQADDSDTEVFWCSADIFTAPRRDFATFQDLVETELFDGQSLEAVWDDVTITFINDHDMDFWLEEHLPYCD